MPAAAGDRTNARSWDIIDVYTGIVGTTGPTDVTTALAAGFTAVGLMADESLTRTRNVDRNELRSFGGRMVRVKRSAQSQQFAFTAIENTDKVFKLANPGSTSVTSAGPTPPAGVTTRTFKEQTSVEVAMVLHMVEGTVISRLYIPKVEVFSDGDTPMGPSDLYQTAMTAIVYPNSTNELFFEITNDPGAVV